MISKLKGIILVVILSLASIMMPFNVYADTIDSHIRGRNYTYEPITYNEVQVSTNTYYENIGVIHITFELDDEYIGYVLPNYTIQYDNYFYGASTPNWGTLSKTFDRRIFVNGSSFSFDIPINWNSISINTAPGGDPFNYDSYTITSSDVTKYADIDSLDQIINILQDLYTSNDQVEGLLSDQLTQLQLIVSNTSLANTYLDKISQIRQYNIPFESFSFTMFLLSKQYEIYEFSDVYYINYPRFIIPSGQSLYITNGSSSNTDITNSFDLIFVTNKQIRNTTEVNDNLSINNGELSYVRRISTFVIGGSVNYLIQIRATNFTASGRKDITVNSQTYVIPICAFYTREQRFSTDFAIQFGLSNDLLNNIQIIANGTTQSNSAASDLETEASEYSEIADDVIGVEEGLTSNFETAVNQIDLNTGLNGFGGNFMTSATWVRTQFDRLTENTPYGSLVVYGLTLGFVLLMLGKVLL